MENKSQLAEMESPQLRQMVMENTKRINRNELKINKMRMDKEEFDQRMRKHDEWFEKMERLNEQSRLEHEKYMAELRERARIHDEKFEADLERWRKENEEERKQWKKDNEEERKRRRKENEEERKQWKKDNEEERKRWSKERDEKFEAEMEQWKKNNEEERKRWSKERDEKFEAEMEQWKKNNEEERKRRRKENEEERKQWKKDNEEERKQWRKEFQEEMRKREIKWEKEEAKRKASLDKLEKNVNKAVESVNRLSAEFHSVVDHTVEGLLGPKGHKMFTKAGFAVDRYCKDMHRKIKALNLEMEVDVLSYGEDLAIATEVKTNCRKTDIDEYIDKMQRFKLLFTEHKDKEVIAAIAAVNFERDAYEYAQQQGILIIHVIDESIFTLDPVPDKSALRRF